MSYKTQQILMLMMLITATFSDEIRYKRVDHSYSDENTNTCHAVIHEIMVDIEKVNISLIPASDTKVAVRKPFEDFLKSDNILVSINASFFNKDGSFAGLTKVNDQILGYSHAIRGAMCWNTGDSSSIIFDQLKMTGFVCIDDRKIDITRINRPLKNKGINCYTKTYSDKVKTNPNYTYIDIEPFNGRSTEIVDDVIEMNDIHYLIAVHNSEEDIIGLILNANNAHVEIVLYTTFHDSKEINKLENILSGAPLLIFDGLVIPIYDRETINESFITQRHARTAIGLTSNNEFVIIVVEEGLFFGGISIPELANYMKEIGCEYALNLDGGRSSSLYTINNGTIYSKKPTPKRYFSYR
ncbi:phosphodiester glycosidase family protein [Chlamydiia bacterium]|nr:phosphodiester glycosidase family protein [Chlamydiia bacterium]